MTENTDHKFTLISYEPCDAGTYETIWSVVNDQSKTVVKDILGNTFSISPNTYYENVGNLYYFGEDRVKSNKKTAYPNNGYIGDFLYRLVPAETRFMKYYIDPEGEVTDIVMSKDRYFKPHEDVFINMDTSLYETVIGTEKSTNEESIPDAFWQHYFGTYMGESIPFLGIVEQVIPESEILGIPVYDKQVNTSETLKYGTVASASITFVLNKPVDEAITHNNDYLVIWYDFENEGN